MLADSSQTGDVFQCDSCVDFIRRKAIEDQPKRSKERERQTTLKLSRVRNLSHENYAKHLKEECPFSSCAKVRVSNDKVAVAEATVEIVKNGSKDFSRYANMSPEQARHYWLADHAGARRYD